MNLIWEKLENFGKEGKEYKDTDPYKEALIYEGKLKYNAFVSLASRGGLV
ncbi:MAG: hypothetical protein ABIL45_04345 [candidate division WOR-3 bacterium]